MDPNTADQRAIETLREALQKLAESAAAGSQLERDIEHAAAWLADQEGAL